MMISTCTSSDRTRTRAGAPIARSSVSGACLLERDDQEEQAR